MSLLDYSELSGAIAARRSVRAYDGNPLSGEELRLMRLFCAAKYPISEGARVELVTDGSGELFTGLAIKKARAALVMIGDFREPHVDEAVGFVGEYVILGATSMGLGTCWVTATYRPQVAAGAVALKEAEKVFAVSPLGHGGRTGFVENLFNNYLTKSRERRPLESMVAGDGLPLDSAPGWIRSALEAARLAPSAFNRQPWRFEIGLDFIKVYVDADSREVAGASRRMDCGMAMAHLEIAALEAGVSGTWEFLPEPGVACFRAK